MLAVPARSGGCRAVAIAAAVVLAACASTPTIDAPAVTAHRVVAPDQAAADGTFVIGAVLAAHGVLAPEESVVLTALRAAVAHQNAGAGIGGRDIELLVGDTASSIVEAARVANQFADAGADVLFVGCDVDIASTVARVARRASRVAVSSCAADDAFGTDTASNVAFSFAPSALGHADALARRLVAGRSTSAVTLSDLVPYESTGACRRFGARYRERGGTVVAEIEIGVAESAATIAARVARVAASSVLVSCLGRAHVGPILEAVRSAGFKSPIVAIGEADAPPWPGGRVDGVTFVTTANLWPADPGLAPLVAAGAVSGPALHTFITIDVLAQAAAAASDARSASIIEKLRGTTFATVIGPLRFDTRQRAVDVPIVFARTAGGGAENSR